MGYVFLVFFGFGVEVGEAVYLIEDFGTVEAVGEVGLEFLAEGGLAGADVSGDYTC